MRLNRTLPPRDARGQVLVVVALLFVMLMIFSAFVIDVGAAYLERRQDVTAADGGVLGGASWLLEKDNPTNNTLPFNKDVIGREAVEVARRNMRPLPSVAAWNDQFAACSDFERNLAEYPIGPNYQAVLSDGRPTDCVHFNTSFTRIRVRLPKQAVPTTFARVIGINFLYTHAVAEAEISLTRDGAPMPFAIHQSPGDANRHYLKCLRLDNCNGVPNHQDAKLVDAPLFARTPLRCGWMDSRTNNNNTAPDDDPADVAYRAAQNAAVGLDHVVVIRGLGPPIESKRSDDCGPGNQPPAPQPLPNWLYAMEFDALSNNAVAAARSMLDGMASGLVFGCPTPCASSPFSDGGPPRLQRFQQTDPPVFPGAWQTRTLEMNGSPYVVDDRPLWDFITPGVTRVGHASCNRDTFNASAWDPADPDETGPTTGHLTICLGEWMALWESGANPPPLFDYDSGPADDKVFDIELSARVGLVPLVGNKANNPTWAPSPITGFETLFVQTLYMQPTGAANDICPEDASGVSHCAVEYNPGVATAHPGDTTIDPGDAINSPIPVSGLRSVGMGFYWIHDEMLPEDARPTQSDTLGGETELIR